MSRTSNSIKNTIAGVIANIVNILVGFIAQRFFVQILGVEFLGINGIFANILSLLNIVELGIGEAIIFNLYKPIAKHDTRKIRSLMLFYKKAYRVIAFTIAGVGLILTPFIEQVTGGTSVDVNLKIVFLLFLGQTVSSYLATYKRSIVYAMQKNYVISVIHIAYLLALNIAQITILYTTKNYYLYLFAKIICNLAENFSINFYARKHYSEFFDRRAEKIDKSTSRDISRRVKAMGLHKIGGFIINGTDNLLISNLFGIASVGLYSNYYLITNAATQLFSQVINSSTASIGNLLTEKNTEKNFKTYKRIRFLNFYLATVTGACLLSLIQPFITLWLGEEYLLPLSVVVVITINYYQKLMRKTYDSFMVAAGICVENRFVPLIESVLNIIFSIVFAKLFGIIGIFIGTVVSGFALWFYSYPRFMYEKILERPAFEYFWDFLRSFAAFVLLAGLTYFLVSLIRVDGLILLVTLRGSVAFTSVNILFLLLYRKNESLVFYWQLLLKNLKKIHKPAKS